MRIEIVRAAARIRVKADDSVASSARHRRRGRGRRTVGT